MPKVYIVQEPNRVTVVDGVVTNVIPTYNYDPAKVYGELVYCMRHGNARFSARQTVLELRHALRNFTVDDFILPTGDPGVIGMAIALAAKQTLGKVKVLRWMRKDKDYLVMEYDLNITV